jgi:hypothetical protein
MSERRQDDGMRDRLSAIQVGYERFARRVLWALVTIALVLVGSLVANAFLVDANRHRASEARALAVQIQHERRDACRAQNKRHADTIRTLDRLLAKLRRNASASVETRLQATRNNNLALINALAPTRNCATVAKVPSSDAGQ